MISFAIFQCFAIRLSLVSRHMKLLIKLGAHSANTITEGKTSYDCYFNCVYMVKYSLNKSVLDKQYQVRVVNSKGIAKFKISIFQINQNSPLLQIESFKTQFMTERFLRFTSSKKVLMKNPANLCKSDKQIRLKFWTIFQNFSQNHLLPSQHLHTQS